MTKSKLFSCLFALPFLGVGIWALISITGTLIDWKSMQNWEPVQTYVLSGGYHTNSGSKSNTYKAYGEYTYVYNGREYRSTRVQINDTADNIGKHQIKLGQKLKRAAKQKEPIEAYVNPDNPNDSIINRDIRLEMVGFKLIFLVAFGGFGLALLIVLFTMPKEKDSTLPLYKEKPWLINDKWQTNEIYSTAKLTLYITWGFAIFWNAISSPILFILAEEILEENNYFILIALIFPLIGAGLIIQAVRKTLEWKKFGRIPVILDPFPGSIDGQVGGTIELPHSYSMGTQFTVMLSNIYSHKSGNSKNRNRSEKIIWQDTAIAYTESGIYGTRIVFRFDVPEGLNASDALKNSSNSYLCKLNLKATGILRNNSNYYLWRLNLKATLPGVDIDRNYEIPVYPTRKKSAYISQRDMRVSEDATLQMEDLAARAKIFIRQGVYGDEMFYPMGRFIGTALIDMFVGATFLGMSGFLMFYEKMHIFGGIFALFGIPIFLGSLYMCTNSLTVYKTSLGNIQTVRRIFGLPVKKCNIPLENISSIEKEHTFSFTIGNKQVKYYAVHVPLSGYDRKKMILGEGFYGEGETDAAITIIKETLGIQNNQSGKRS